MLNKNTLSNKVLSENLDLPEERGNLFNTIEIVLDRRWACHAKIFGSNLMRHDVP